MKHGHIRWRLFLRNQISD